MDPNLARDLVRIRFRSRSRECCAAEFVNDGEDAAAGTLRAVREYFAEAMVEDEGEDGSVKEVIVVAAESDVPEYWKRLVLLLLSEDGYPSEATDTLLLRSASTISGSSSLGPTSSGTLFRTGTMETLLPASS